MPPGQVRDLLDVIPVSSWQAILAAWSQNTEIRPVIMAKSLPLIVAIEVIDLLDGSARFSTNADTDFPGPVGSWTAQRAWKRVRALRSAVLSRWPRCGS